MLRDVEILSTQGAKSDNIHAIDQGPLLSVLSPPIPDVLAQKRAHVLRHLGRAEVNGWIDAGDVMVAKQSISHTLDEGLLTEWDLLLSWCMRGDDERN